MPPKNIIAIIVVEYPAIGPIPIDVKNGLNILCRNANITPKNVNKETTVPKYAEMVSGVEEKETIPSDASFNSFLNGYFVSPANLACLSYSSPTCLNPAQALKPLTNLFLSGSELITFTTFLSINEKSPESSGIFKSDKDESTL